MKITSYSLGSSIKKDLLLYHINKHRKVVNNKCLSIISARSFKCHEQMAKGSYGNGSFVYMYLCVYVYVYVQGVPKKTKNY